MCLSLGFPDTGLARGTGTGREFPAGLGARLLVLGMPVPVPVLGGCAPAGWCGAIAMGGAIGPKFN